MYINFTSCAIVVQIDFCYYLNLKYIVDLHEKANNLKVNDYDLHTSCMAKDVILTIFGAF